MSTQPFGQPPAFGAVPAGPPEPAPVEAPTKGGRTVVLAVAAGVVALGVLGGAAFLVLGTGDDTTEAAVPPGTAPVVEPSAAPSTPPAPLPTAAIRARNVFLPLVDPEADAAAAAAESEAAAAPTSTPTPSPSATPTALTPVPVPVPTSAPVPAVTRTVTVPGPVVTEAVPGPTVTTTTPGPVQTVDRFAYAVQVVSVEDPDTAVDGDSTATFVVNGEEIAVLEGDYFLEVFQYEGYQPAVDPETEDTVTFYFGSSVWSVSTGTSYGLGPR